MAEHTIPHSYCIPTEGKEDQSSDVYQKYAEIVKTLPEVQCWPAASLQQYQGFWFSSGYGLECVMAAQDHFTSRSSDVLLATLPKVGTTWLKALAFATANRAAGSLYPMSALLSHNPHECVPSLELQLYDGKHATNVDAIPSPRLLGTHMPYSLLPKSAVDPLDGCKIVYLCRNPRDTCIATWKYINGLMPPHMVIDLEHVVGCFVDGTHWGGPFWDHVLGYWNASRANPERVLFMRYEELQRDPVAELKKLAAFIGRPFSKEEEEEEEGVVEKIIDMCSIKNLSNLNVNREGVIESVWTIQKSTFFRKGVVGDWANHLTPEMVEKLDRVVEDKLQGSGLSFIGFYDP